MDDVALIVGDSAFDAVLVIDEAFVVQPQQVQGGGVEVIGIGGVPGGFPAQFISGTVADSATDSAAGHPGGEGARIVVAAQGPVALGGGLAPKLGGADHQSLIEQSARFQVLE